MQGAQLRRAALGLALALLGAPAAAQASPEALAAQLQAALRAGDAAAYTRLLAPSGTFAVEGPNFAADLARTPQPSATLTFGDLRPDEGGASARLNLSWERLPGTVSRVAFPVRLARVQAVWRYAGEDFQALPAGGWTLLALREPGFPERAAPVGPLIPQAARQVAEVLGLTVPADATVKVYPDMATLSASVALSLQPVGGWNEPGEAIKLVLDPGPDQTQTRRVLAHELTHLALSEAVREGPGRRVPWWLHEGLADFVARAHWTPEQRAARQERTTGYARADWVPLAELADFPSVPEERWRYVYAQGLGIVDFLTAKVGPDAPMQLALAYAEQNRADDAARAVGFATFSELERTARDWLAVRP